MSIEQLVFSYEVYFRDDYYHRHVECECQLNVVHCGLAEARPRIHNQQRIVRVVTANAFDHGFGVLLVSCHVYESEDFLALFDDLGPT